MSQKLEAKTRARSGAIAEAAIEVLLDRRCCVMWDDVEVLNEIAHRAGIQDENPTRCHRRIFTALDRDSRFDKALHKGRARNGHDAWMRIFCLSGNGLEHVYFGYLEPEEAGGER